MGDSFFEPRSGARITHFCSARLSFFRKIFFAHMRDYFCRAHQASGQHAIAPKLGFTIYQRKIKAPRNRTAFSMQKEAFAYSLASRHFDFSMPRL